MKTVYENPWFRVQQDGQWHFVEEPAAAHSAVVLAYVGEQLLLVKVPRRAHGCSLWELPRGYAEPGESVLQCAARELAEETGYVAKSEAFSVVGVVRPNTALLSSALTVCTVHLPEHAQAGPRDHEAEAVRTVSVAELTALIAAGEFSCGISLAALMLAKK